MISAQTAVVILNYNGRDFLRKFLPGVIEHSAGASIIVADNCSTDDSVQILNHEFPTVEIIHIAKNLGFCGGYNYALQQVSAPYFVLLNSDVEVTQGWLAPMTTLLDQHPGISAVQPKILSWHTRDEFEYAGAAGGFIDTLGYPFCRGRIFDSVERDSGQYNDERPIFWATGACLAIRSKVFHKLGGFDEDFFAHMEEIDLCWKIHRSGETVYYTGSSTVFHVGGGTLSKLNPRKTYLNFRNGLTLILKNMKPGELMWKLPLRMMLDWIALLKFLTAGAGGNALEVLRAHAHFMGHVPAALKKRKAFSHLRVDVRRQGTMYPGSVIVSYFVKGRKLFGQFRF